MSFPLWVIWWGSNVWAGDEPIPSLSTDTLTPTSLPLTEGPQSSGVSRRRGISVAVASRLAWMGASLAVHHFVSHDMNEYEASDELEELLAELCASRQGQVWLVEVAGDLGDAATADLAHSNVSISSGRGVPSWMRTRARHVAKSGRRQLLDPAGKRVPVNVDRVLQWACSHGGVSRFRWGGSREAAGPRRAPPYLLD